MHTRRRSRTTAWVVGLLTCLVAACSTGVDGRTTTADQEAPVSSSPTGEASGSGGGPTGDEARHLVDDATTTWDVELAEVTTLVDGDALDAVKSADGDGGYTFDADAAQRAGLDLSEGRVLLVAGDSLGRIVDSSTASGAVTVATEPASLADAIDDGEVGWDVPLTYDFDHFVTDPDEAAVGGGTVEPSAATPDPSRPRLTEISMALPDGRRVPVVGADEDGGPSGLEDVQITAKPEDGAVEWEMTVGGTRYQFRITAQGETAEFLVVVSRGGDGEPTMAYRGEGTLGALRSSSSTSIAGGEVSGSEVGVSDLAAELKLSASVAGAGVTPVDLEVPVPMLKFIWMVGPVPVTVEVGAKIIGNVEATVQASATAEAAFSYQGSTGFSFDGGGVSASGATDVGEMDPEPADSAAPMGVDVDAQFGVAFPEVSLSLFGQGFVPSIHFGAVVGSNLTWGVPKAGFAASSICKSAYVRAEVVGSYDFKVLGHSLDKGEHEFWADRNDAAADSPGCDDDG